MVEIHGITIPTWVCLSVPTMALAYSYLRSKANYWKKRGIPGPSSWILFGNMPQVMSEGMRQFDLDMKKKYGKFVGTDMHGVKSLNIYDLDIMKDVLIKEFSSFQNHTNPGGQTYPFRKMITMLQFDHWKHVRTCLSPAFTGSKLRHLTAGINRCCKNWMDYLDTIADQEEGFEMKEACGKVTMDIIANNVFGIDVDSFKDPNNEFQRNGQAIVNLGNNFSFRLFFFMIFPNFAEKIGLSLLDPKCQAFFDHAIKQSLKFRQEAKDEQVARDFLQMMVEADQGEPQTKDMANNPNLKKSEDGWIYTTDGLTSEEIIAAAFAYFFAGFDTVSTSVALLLFELARNEDVQEKLFKEIVEVLGDKDEPDYDDVKRMSYLSMCVDESLRLYPPATRTERMCNKDIELGGVKIEKGVSVIVPIIYFHMDPDIWPEPERYDPERFTQEQKESRHPLAYMPFGLGPRHCVAMRQGLLQVKLIAIHIIKNFKITPTGITEYPIKMMKIKQDPVDGLHLKIQRG